MTIKQALIGVVVSSSIVGLMVHRMWKAKDLQARPHVVASSKTLHHKDKADSHKTASLRNRNSETTLSSRKLYGR